MPKTILICDDDKLTVELLSFALKIDGYNVLHVHDCESVWGVLSHRKPDAILMDLWVPQMGGEAATIALKKHWGADLKIIMMSTAFDLRKVASQSGADAFLMKPFKVEELKTILETHIMAGEE